MFARLLGFACLGLMSAVPRLAVAQSAVVQGQVQASDGAGIPYANVRVTGTADGAATNEQGRFHFRTRRTGRVQLRASAVGYEAAERTRRLAPGDTVPVSFVLASSRVQLDETVVTGEAYSTGLGDVEEKREQILGCVTKHLKQATELDENMADAWALLAGVYGQRMGLNPMQAVTLGGDADAGINRAKKLAPDNPRLWIIDGTQDFFGGTKSVPSRSSERRHSSLSRSSLTTRCSRVGATPRPMPGLALHTCRWSARRRRARRSRTLST